MRKCRTGPEFLCHSGEAGLTRWTERKLVGRVTSHRKHEVGRNWKKLVGRGCEALGREVAHTAVRSLGSGVQQTSF